MSKCNRNLQSDNFPLMKIYRATSQKWSGGVAGSGKGIYYQFYLPAADSALTFDSVWVDGYRLSLKRYSSVENKDTFILQADAYFTAGSFDANTKPSGPDMEQLPSDKIKCAGLMRYKFRNSLPVEYCIPIIEKLPPLNYP